MFAWKALPFAMLAIVGLATLLPSCSTVQSVGDGPELQTITLRVHHMDRMLAFYGEAFGVEFREVDTFGITSQFGQLGAVTLQFVPIRESAQFEEYPIHLLGFEVDDLRAVLAMAEDLGGRQDGALHQDEGRLAGTVRDPDGNTIELYERRTNPDGEAYGAEPFDM